jgi:hypothetical protein
LIFLINNKKKWSVGDNLFREICTHWINAMKTSIVVFLDDFVYQSPIRLDAYNKYLEFVGLLLFMLLVDLHNLHKIYIIYTLMQVV